MTKRDDQAKEYAEESRSLDGYHPMVRDFILGQGCFSQEAPVEAAKRVGEKIGKAAAKAMNDALVEEFAPRPPLAPKDVVSILAEGDRRLRELASKAMVKCLKAQFEALDECWGLKSVSQKKQEVAKNVPAEAPDYFDDLSVSQKEQEVVKDVPAEAPDYFDDLATVAMERDAAISERDAAVAKAAEDARAYAAESDARAHAQQELHDRCDNAFAPTESAGNGDAERLHRETWLRLERDELIIKRDELISRVAELEAASGGREPKLAPHANAGGESNHAAPAASGGGVIPDMVNIILSDTDADEKHAALSTLVEAVCPGWVMTQAASGCGEREPVAWTFTYANRSTDGRFYNSQALAEAACPRNGTVVPLYRDPPQPRGWLTGEEREVISSFVNGPYVAARHAGVLSRLLSRLSPPEVVLPPQPREIDGNNFYDRQVWNAALNEVRKALAAAGVAVKEVP